jgi:hypothetical protein
MRDRGEGWEASWWFLGLVRKMKGSFEGSRMLIVSFRLNPLLETSFKSTLTLFPPHRTFQPSTVFPSSPCFHVEEANFRLKAEKHKKNLKYSRNLLNHEKLSRWIMGQVLLSLSPA